MSAAGHDGTPDEVERSAHSSWVLTRVYHRQRLPHGWRSNGDLLVRWAYSNCEPRGRL